MTQNNEKLVINRSFLTIPLQRIWEGCKLKTNLTDINVQAKALVKHLI